LELAEGIEQDGKTARTYRGDARVVRFTGNEEP